MASIMVPTFAFTRTHRATTFQMTKEKKNLCKPRQKAGFEVLTAVSMKMTVFWVVAPCSLVKVYQRFRGPCCLYHQGDNPEDSHLQDKKIFD
jgi:hypothetical protein